MRAVWGSLCILCMVVVAQVSGEFTVYLILSQKASPFKLIIVGTAVTGMQPRKSSILYRQILYHRGTSQDKEPDF